MAYVAHANCKECGQGRAADQLDANGVCPRCRLTFIRCEPNPHLQPENYPIPSEGENVVLTLANGEILSAEVSRVEEDEDGATVLTLVLW